MTGHYRLGILGGTFDPIHLGHLAAAEAARATLGLDRVLLVPSHHPPHRSGPRVSGYHRFAMVALAVSARDGLLASDIELTSEDRSYTWNTLARLRAGGLAASQLFFIAGADAFAEIATWKNYPAILDLCHFVVIARPDDPLEALRARLPDLSDRTREASGSLTTIDRPGGAGDETPRVFLVDARTPSVSSTEIRRRASAGEPLAGLVPPEVERYIGRHGLYKGSGGFSVGNLHE